MEDNKPRSGVLRQAIERSKEYRVTPKPMLTVAEACEYLRISKWTLYRLIQTGKLRSIKMGGRRLFRRQSILDFINRLEAETGV